MQQSINIERVRKIAVFTSLDPESTDFIWLSQWQRTKAPKFYHTALNRCLFWSLLKTKIVVVNLKLTLGNKQASRSIWQVQVDVNERNVLPCWVVFSVNSAGKWRALSSIWLRMKAVTASQSTNNFKVVCLNKEVLYTALVHNKMSSSFANAATTIILNELSNNILNCIAKFFSAVPL